MFSFSLAAPVEYQKKDASVDNIFPEKKLLITKSPTQIKKYASPQEESAESMSSSFTLFLTKLESPSCGFVNRSVAICFFGLIHAPHF